VLLDAIDLTDLSLKCFLTSLSFKIHSQTFFPFLNQVSENHVYTASLDGTVRHFERGSTDCTGLISSSDSNSTNVCTWFDQVIICCDSTTIDNVLILPAKKLLWGTSYPDANEADEDIEAYYDPIVNVPVYEQPRKPPHLTGSLGGNKVKAAPKKKDDAAKASAKKREPEAKKSPTANKKVKLDASGVPVVKRPVGRPPKVKPVVEAPVEAVQIEQGGGEPPPQPRKRGRPRKDQSKPADPAAAKPTKDAKETKGKEEEWRTEGHQFIGLEVTRDFDGEVTKGTVVSWIKAGAGKDEPALWRIRHADGDEEDLEELEVIEAMQPSTTGIVTGADKLLKANDEVLAYEKDRLLYDAKVVEVKEDAKKGRKYLIHYQGWNDKYNRWLPPQDVLQRSAISLKYKTQIAALPKAGKKKK